MSKEVLDAEIHNTPKEFDEKLQEPELIEKTATDTVENVKATDDFTTHTVEKVKTTDDSLKKTEINKNVGEADGTRVVSSDDDDDEDGLDSSSLLPVPSDDDEDFSKIKKLSKVLFNSIYYFIVLFLI